MSEAPQGVRLAKQVAAQQGCSRSQAEALIGAGAVELAGETVTDPARRVLPGQAVVVRTDMRPAQAGLTVLLHKPAGVSADQALQQAWPSLGQGPGPRRGLRECWPLPEAASGLSVWSDEPPVLRRLADRERPLEVEWQLGLPLAAAAPVLQTLQALGLRLSLGHERAGMGLWRVVGKGPQAAEWLAAVVAGWPASAQWRRQRLGRLGLAPLAPGQARLRRDIEKF